MWIKEPYAYIYLFAAVMLTGTPGVPQSVSVGLSDSARPQASPTIKSNLWRSQAVALDRQVDTVSPAVRAARDRYWNTIFPAFAGEGGVAYSTGGVIGMSPAARPREFSPEALKYPWIIGKFEAFHVYQTSGHGGLYTEMNVQVRHVFQGAPAEFAEGMVLDVSVRGGAAVDAEGRSISFLLADKKPLIEPNHVYLMQVIPCISMTPCGAGGFYYLGRKWDLTDGTVTPIDDFELRMWKDGISIISGTDASTIIPRFAAILATLSREATK